jgi:hypothetical protein
MTIKPAFICFTLIGESTMTHTRNTIAATFAAIVIGGLTMSHASAATKWSDISAVTHGGGATAQPKAGSSDAYSRTDLSAVTHGSKSTAAKQIGRFSSDNYSASDITSITHN